MKTAAIPAVRVPPQLRQAAEEVLSDGETLSGFVEDAVRRNVEYRRAQTEFVGGKRARLELNSDGILKVGAGGTAAGGQQES